MMWRSTDRLGRIEKALEYRAINHEKINLYYDLHRTLIRRGITDTKLCDVYNILIHYLEPKSCQMSHCEDHGVAGFCNCCKNIVPSKCKKHRDFLKRCKSRAVKAADWFLEVKKERYNDLPLNLDTHNFFAKLREIPGFEPVEKWSYRLEEDVLKELLKREKTNEETS